MATYAIRRATVDDLYEVIMDPSGITDDEFKAHGLSRWQALKIAREWFTPHTADALTENGKVICVFGHNQHVDYKHGRTTWFVTRQRFWDIGARGVAIGRRYMRSLQWKWPGYTFYTFSDSGHPAVDRWFTLLGYTVVHDNGRKLFKFLPNIDKSDMCPVTG